MNYAGETLANITVFVFPPNEFWSNLVNFESLYGICCDLPSTNALITFPKALNDKFIFCAYFNLYP